MGSALVEWHPTTLGHPNLCLRLPFELSSRNNVGQDIRISGPLLPYKVTDPFDTGHHELH